MITADAAQQARADAAVSDLWHFYDEHAAQARQHESLRASVTSTLSAVAAAVVGLAGVGGIERSDVILGATVVVIGLLGAAISIKHYERNRFHTQIMKAVRDGIGTVREDPTRTPPKTSTLRNQGEEAHRVKFAILGRPDSESGSTRASPWVSIRLHLLWMGLPLIIAVVGGVVIALSLLA